MRPSRVARTQESDFDLAPVVGETGTANQAGGIVIRTVYFDTNIFDHIYKKIGVTRTSLKPLWKAVAEGRLSIILSIMNIEEVLAALHSSPAMAVNQLWLILKRCDWDRIVKPADILLREAISCYASGKGLPSPFTVDPSIKRGLERLNKPTQRDLEELNGMLEERREHKANFLARMKAARKNWVETVRPQVRRLKCEPPDFKSYWEVSAVSFAERLAAEIGLGDACRERGIEGLLEVRSVRLAVGANLSVIYSQTFEGRAADKGDAFDLQHAVLASAADVLVTNDGIFGELMARIPMPGFEVTDLGGLSGLICRNGL